jgi:hypothetical protein
MRLGGAASNSAYYGSILFLLSGGQGRPVPTGRGRTLPSRVTYIENVTSFMFSVPSLKTEFMIFSGLTPGT